MEPETTTVIEGGTAIFPCKYPGLRYDAIWIINNTFYLSSTLPSFPTKHVVLEIEGAVILNVIDVHLFINSTTYQCVVHDGHSFIYSNKAYLYICKYIHKKCTLVF